MLWHRCLLSNEEVQVDIQSSLLGDNGPGKLKKLKEKTVRYKRTKIPERMFLDAHKGYSLAERGTDWFRFTKIWGAIGCPDSFPLELLFDQTPSLIGLVSEPARPFQGFDSFGTAG